MPERDAFAAAPAASTRSISATLTEAMLREAERCIQCVKPTCIEGCPVRIDIPRFIRHLMVARPVGGAGGDPRIESLPSICGRLPAGEPVRGAVRDRRAWSRWPSAGSSVRRRSRPSPAAPRAVGRLEGWPRGDRRLGPGGLAAAADLAADYDVTVFEALHVVGGVLRYGIPRSGCRARSIERELQLLRDAGVKFQTNKVIGKTFGIQQLMERMGFDAVFIAAGAARRCSSACRANRRGRCSRPTSSSRAST